MIVTIHQPEHLIWLGLVDKISKADIFVILDTVQYRKNYFQNRNKIRTQKGWTWLTVPVKKHPLKTKIIDVEISYNQDWLKRYLNLIQVNYQEAKYFNKFYPILEKTILKKYQHLSDLNSELIGFILSQFEIKPKIFKASELNLPEIKGGSKIVLEICKALSADTYLSGISGKDYLKLSDFKAAGIKVIFHQFYHPIYKQLYEPFIPCMSSIDLLFNYGSKAKNILWGKDTKRLDYLIGA
jgi:hypothetical protein